MTLPIHPFPARMAPELALDALKSANGPALVLDPMSGSGTAVRHAAMQGHQAFGCDLDPLAVLMARVWTTPLSPEEIQEVYQDVVRTALRLDPCQLHLHWIDDHEETRRFVHYWFAKKQRDALRCLAAVLVEPGRYHISEHSKQAIDALKISLSRIIVTKEQRASLARDTSHSRPHRVATDSEYDVFQGFKISVNQVAKRLETADITGCAQVEIGDARKLVFSDNYFDVILTSPPYLNAIDYMRGHRLALVWLGFQVDTLRRIRSASIGAERGPDAGYRSSDDIVAAFGDYSALPTKYVRMIERYAIDLEAALSEAARVLKPGGQAVYVVGNSCLKNNFVSNSRAVSVAAELAGMRLEKESERELPASRRYLPMKTQSVLQNRMRTESVLTFAKP